MLTVASGVATGSPIVVPFAAVSSGSLGIALILVVQSTAVAGVMTVTITNDVSSSDPWSNTIATVNLPLLTPGQRLRYFFPETCNLTNYVLSISFLGVLGGPPAIGYTVGYV